MLITSSSKKNDRIRQIRVYPVTDEKYLFGDTHSARILAVINGGAGMVQLRDKTAPMNVMYHEALKIRRLTHQHNVVFIVNDRVDLAWISNADGVHLGQDDFPVDEARNILGSDAIIGISTHTVEQVEQALQTSADYLAFGPVYPTCTKQNAEPVQGLKMLEEITKIIDRPLFAIGGVTLSRVAEVLKHGATGVAVISDIFGIEDAQSKMAEYAQAVRKILIKNNSETNDN